jgi:hypothetical protein
MCSECGGREEVVESPGRILNETAGLEKAEQLLFHQEE